MLLQPCGLREVILAELTGVFDTFHIHTHHMSPEAGIIFKTPFHIFYIDRLSHWNELEYAVQNSTEVFHPLPQISQKPRLSSDVLC